MFMPKMAGLFSQGSLKTASFAEINAHIYHQKYFPYNGAFIWVV